MILFFGAVTLLIHFLTNGRYGYFRDELYYIACGQHLAFGYVDMAPLSALLVRVSRVLFGDSLFALRFLPAVAGAFTVALTGMIARELGGRGWAVALSCAASLSALVYLGIGNFFSMNAFEPLFWMGAIYLLVRIINGGSPRLWLWFGALIGLGLENKHSMAFFAAGVCVALLLTPERRHLAQKWIWLGGLIALGLALPNVIWQMQHHWPTWELLHNIAQSNKNVVLSPAQFIAQQILIMNPATLPLWLGGIIWLLASRDGRRYRVIAIAYLITLAEFMFMHGKHYYLAPVYPMLFAAGAVAVERLFAIRWQWLKPALLVAMIALAALMAPTVIPILPPGKLRRLHEGDPFRTASHRDLAHRGVAAAFRRSIRLGGNGRLGRARLHASFGPRIGSGPESSARITAKPARSIFSVPSSDCRPRSPAIKIIFSGDRAVTPAMFFSSSTTAMKTNGSNSNPSRISARS